jgi:hypothetical protein
MLDLNAPLDRLIVLLKTITGLADDADGTVHVHKGVPPSFPTRLTAYVALADFPATNERATQLQAVTADYAVGFGYRVGGDEAAAETAMCTAALAFLLLMKQATNRTLDPGTGALVDDTRLVSGGSGRPSYQPVAGQEFRLIEVLVRTVQRQTY